MAPGAAPEGGAWAEWVASENAALLRLRLARSLRAVEPVEGRGAVVRVADEAAWGAGAARGSSLRLFSSNDYLGLATHPAVREAAARAAARHGCGPRASALVAGYTAQHAELEDALAGLKGAEAAVLYPTGYAANTAALAALASVGVASGGARSGGAAAAAVFSDALNHASIVDGARLASRGSAGVELHVYRHNDLAHLEALLLACDAPRKLVVTDSLFSMDGDFADLEGLAALRARHGFLLCVDEAHATLVCGERGGGAAQMLGVEDSVDVHVGTLSKAFGAHGGFVACGRDVKQLLLSRGRPGIFSTALPLPAVAAASAALHEATPERRATLWANVDAFGAATGLELSSPIAPVVLGAEQAALDASAALLRDGFHVPAIRPPTVPRGTARLRVALSAEHTAADVADLAVALRGCGALRPNARL